MDPNRMSGGGDRRYAGQDNDPPPSYNEAMKSQPNPHINYSTPIPSAPTLESTASANTCPIDASAYFPQADASHSLAQNYPEAEKWDNRATRMLVMNRLQMQRQFDDAKSEMENEALWNMLLNQLLGYGYNFTVNDLTKYWDFQFQIYKNIVNDLQTGSVTATDWEFFEPMNRVFGHYDLVGAVPSSTSLLSNIPIPIIVPIPTPGPSITLPTNVPSSDLPSSSASNVISQPNSSLSADVPLTNLNNGSDPANKNQEPITTQPEGLPMPKFDDANVPETVVTTQPTYDNTQTAPQEQTTAANNRRNDNGCCNDTGCYPIFCIDFHNDYHYHHSHDDGCCDCCGADGGCCNDGGGGGCCEGDGGGCCDGGGGDGGGCCDGGNDTGCCDGGDGCDGCDDFDCDGCDGC